MRYLSVCSGIEAATCAWHHLDWEPVAFSEIDRFPSLVLKHHYPHVPNLGDMTKYKDWKLNGPIDLLVGGTPCQSFSVAGLRKGLDDPRGNLMLTYLAIAERFKPRWVVWENVPGVFSATSHSAPDPVPPPPPVDMELDGQEVETGDDYDSEEVHAFQCLLAGFSELGYGTAYRVLDAQYAGVPQRRRRVFVVGYLGDWRRAAAVLFERHSMSGHPAPSREAKEDVAGTISKSSFDGGAGGKPEGAVGNHFLPVAHSLRAQAQAQASHRADSENYVPVSSTGNVAHCLNAGGMGRQDYETETLITHALRGEGFDASEDDTGRGTPIVPVAIQAGALRENPSSGPDGVGVQENIAYMLEARAEVQAIAFSAKDHGADAAYGVSPTLRAGGHDESHANSGNWMAVASFSVSQNSNGFAWEGEVSPTLQAHQPSVQSNQFDGIRTGMQVRRLTPMECERLQGFPDGYTDISVKGKPAADGPRYKALGNSMAVPVMRHIGERIQLLEDLVP